MNMKTCLFSLYLSCLTLTVHADDINHQPITKKEGTGFGIGTIAGGLLAGPPGAIVGALSGIWLGARESESDSQIAMLEKELNAKSIELAYQQNELANTRQQYQKEFNKVLHNANIQSLENLSQGISYNIFYKTNDSTIRDDVKPQIRQIANLIKPYPQIKIDIEGHADFRGTDKYNHKLSQKRIDQVKQELLKAGIDAKRLRSRAYGEKKSNADKNDKESYVFDRRVTISLSLDEEA